MSLTILINTNTFPKEVQESRSPRRSLVSRCCESVVGSTAVLSEPSSLHVDGLCGARSVLEYVLPHKAPSPSLFSLEIAELQAFHHDIDEMWLKLNSCLDSPPMVKSGCFKSSPKVTEPVDDSQVRTYCS